MVSKSALVFGLASVAWFLWWMKRPVQHGTNINSVAGLRG